jgi:hypothetical protein
MPSPLHLEHPQASLVGDVAVEASETVPVRAPVRVVPAEVTVDERQDGIDRVVRLVPAFGAGLLEPALSLAELLRRPGQLGVEHERDPVRGLPNVRPQPVHASGVSVGPELAAAERAAEDLEELHPAVNLPCRARRSSTPKHPSYSPPLR